MRNAYVKLTWNRWKTLLLPIVMLPKFLACTILCAPHISTGCLKNKWVFLLREAVRSYNFIFFRVFFVVVVSSNLFPVHLKMFFANSCMNHLYINLQFSQISLKVFSVFKLKFCISGIFQYFFKIQLLRCSPSKALLK